MITKQIIEANPYFDKVEPVGEPFLRIAEFFCDTIQGENFVGYPSAFLRLQGCTLSCRWCDTQEVWRYGNPYTFDELFIWMEYPEFNLIEKLKQGHHLVVTGGSPLLQQYELIRFFTAFFEKYNFMPFIEIENECTIAPAEYLQQIVWCWNNSPKLSNSGNYATFRYQPVVLKCLSELKNSWFKFVVSKEEDWKEIEEDFVKPKLIRTDQIVLMPLAATRDELIANREEVIEMAIRHNVRYSTREHIAVWDKRTGV